MDTRQRVEIIGMFGKQRARARGDGCAKSDLAANPRFAVPTGPFMAERISEVLDWLAGHILKKSAVLRDFRADRRCGCLREVAVSSCVSADRDQRMTRQPLQLIFAERLAVHQRPTINPALRNC